MTIYSDEVIELCRPFPKKYVHDDGRGNAYVPHHVVEQRLVHIFGVPPKTEILREIMDPDGKLTGVVMRMTVPGPVFNFEVEEVGEADNPQAKTNGAKAKSAMSDAYKRCAMRLGLGLHLWAQDDYFLFDAIAKKELSPPPRADSPEPAGEPNLDEGKATPAGSPVLKAKRMAFKKVCEKAGVDPDVCAQELDRPASNLDDCDEEQLDQLLGMRGSA